MYLVCMMKYPNPFRRWKSFMIWHLSSSALCGILIFSFPLPFSAPAKNNPWCSLYTPCPLSFGLQACYFLGLSLPKTPMPLKYIPHYFLSESCWLILQLLSQKPLLIFQWLNLGWALLLYVSITLLYLYLYYYISCISHPLYCKLFRARNSI